MAWTSIDIYHFVLGCREFLSHDNITFNDNGTLTSTPRHPLVWVPELSEGRREDDLLVLPNIALLVSKNNRFFTWFE